MIGSNRNLALVVLARSISRLGGAAVWFIGVMGVAAYGFNATPRQLAIMSAINGVAAIGGSLTAGVLIDRFGPRKVMIWAEMGSIPPVAFMIVASSLPAFAVASAVFSLFGIPTWTAGASFAPYIVEGQRELERANAYIEGGSAVGFVLGPAVAAGVVALAGHRQVFWVMIVASVVAAIAAYFTRIDESPRAHVSGNAWADFKDGLRVAYTTRSLRYYILLGTAVWLGFGAFQALESLFYRDVVGVDVTWLGWMNAIFGVGLVAGAALLPRLPQKVVTARGLAITIALLGAGTVMYVGSTDLRLIGAGAFAWGIVFGASEPLHRTLMHIDSPHEYVGRIVGTAQWHRSAGELVPLAFVPALAAAIGIQETLIAGGAIVAVLAIVSFGEAAAIDRGKRVAAHALEAAAAASALAAGEGLASEPLADEA